MTKIYLKVFVVFIAFVTSYSAFANDEASSIVTPGYGRLEITKNYLLFSSGTSYDVQIPEYIKEGTQINILYKKDGQWINGIFNVVRISVRGELCRLHNKERSPHSSSPGDTIYIKNCNHN